MFFSDANAAETTTTPGTAVPATTVPAGADASAGEPAVMSSVLLPLLPILAVIYFIIIRPQQKRLKEHDTLIKSLRRGDKIVTAGGVVGIIHKVDDDIIVLEVAPDVRIRVVRETISHVVTKTAVANDNKDEGK